MTIPLRQVVRVGAYIAKQKFQRKSKYPLVLMLEPLFRCNLKCMGCGKIQYPEPVLRTMLTPQDCFKAMEECGAPIVSIAGGEPLLHPQISEIAQGFIARKKFVYLCTNGLLLEKRIDDFTPSVFFAFNVHVDGLFEKHDRLVGLEGTFERAISGIRKAKEKNFRVTTNTTVFEGQTAEEIADLLDFLTRLHVDGITISPGYSYEKAQAQDQFLSRTKTKALFKKIFEIGAKRKSAWPFNHSPFYLDFLEGKTDYDCTPWGNPNYSVLGWQKPCYLLGEGHVSTFQQLLEEVPWHQYGCLSGNPKCVDCSVHSGYEPSAVTDSMRNFSNTLRSIRSVLR